MAYHKSNKNVDKYHSQTFLSQERKTCGSFGYVGASGVYPSAVSTQPNESEMLYDDNNLEWHHHGGISENLSYDKWYKHYSNSDCAMTFPHWNPNNKLGVMPHVHQSLSHSQYFEISSDSLPNSENNSEVGSDFPKEMKQEDVSFLVSWIKNIEKHNKEKLINKCKPRRKDLKISAIQNAFVESNQFIMELKLIHSKLTSNICPDADYKSFVQKAEGLKIDLELNKSFISDAISNGQLKEVIQERRNKRQRAKIKKRQRKEKYLRQKTHWKKKGEKIDLWLKKMRDNQEAILQAQEVKKSADSILHEVRTKQEEAHEIKNLVVALCELREIRLKKGEIHGFTAKSDDSQIFENMSVDFMGLIENQLKQYGLEEQTLRVMMENSPNILPDKRNLPNKSPKNFEELKRKIYELLFGKNIPCNELNAQQRFFFASEESAEILIKRRSSWDNYLAESNTPTSISASVPLGWVVPPSTPTSQWKKYYVGL